jgi:hypothetical protein
MTRCCILRSLHTQRLTYPSYRYVSQRSEWRELACWVCKYSLFSTANRWIIQLPRIYRYLRKKGSIASFQELINHIWTPLFEATVSQSPECARKNSTGIQCIWLLPLAAYLHDRSHHNAVAQSQHVSHLQTPPYGASPSKRDHQAVVVIPSSSE